MGAAQTATRRDVTPLDALPHDVTPRKAAGSWSECAGRATRAYRTDRTKIGAVFALLGEEDAIVHYIANHIVDGIESGNVKPCNPEVVAFMMLKTYTALVFDWGRGHTRTRFPF